MCCYQSCWFTEITEFHKSRRPYQTLRDVIDARVFLMKTLYAFMLRVSTKWKRKTQLNDSLSPKKTATENVNPQLYL